MQLDNAIDNIPKLHKPQVAALKKFGINTVEDLLLHFPYRYLDFSQTKPIREIKAGENVTVKASIKNIASRFSFRSRIAMAEAVVSDESGSLKIVWFNQAYLAKSLKAGDEIFLSGAPEYYNFSLQLTNPLYEKASEFPTTTSRLVPVYRLTEKIYPKTFRNVVASVLELADKVEEILPKQILQNQKLLNVAQTIKASHFPKSAQEVENAKKRLAFEEIFLNQLLAQQHKLRLGQRQSQAVKFNQDLIKSFVGSLPFTLTAGQKKAAWEILQDVEKPMPMNRLLEGDVGSGKTVVAFMAALQCAAAGLQVAFMAPTEILAAQHYQTAKKLIVQILCGRTKSELLSLCLLTNNLSKLNNDDIPKSKLQKLIAEGMPGIYIGTHALLGGKVKFNNLALVIIDEQHRFGVEQRSKLIQIKGKVPHLLSLTATPIPRTLQLAYYGELEISQIKSKPADRKPVLTKLVNPADRAKSYQFIAGQIKSGRQAFVITPRIEESENLEIKSAKTEAENLKKIFPGFSIGLLHGKMKSADKEKVMADFLANKLQILVSTSVVEVGVDVPNASVMLIEAAERFGLAQLHQFRGRVGRAEHQSYCFLFTSETSSDAALLQKGKNNAADRLQAFTKTQDGFALAELDLKQRGFGELYGSSQSGWNFKYFNPSYVSLITPAREEAKKLLNEDINLQNYPKLREKIQGKVIHFE